jgi:enoyl-CoA hydratase/carnithine racemase
MDFVQVSKRDGAAELLLRRGKVNAIDEQVVRELGAAFRELEDEAETKAIVLTSQGPFFSFGFDIPELLDYPKASFLEFLAAFSDLYTYLFAYPKPIVAALNGHAIAGGCMLALACDFRIMVSGKARISLNEITFGASLFAGSVRMLRFAVGDRNAQTIACDGSMYSAEEAQRLGLVDQISSVDALAEVTREAASRFVAKDAAAFRGIKGLLRKPVADEMAAREGASLREFADI